MELVTITEKRIGEELVQTVNARELHGFLEVQTAFKDWISRRITEYEFIDDLDFFSFLSGSSGGRPSKEYVITIDMAKELSMVERNQKGKPALSFLKRYVNPEETQCISDVARILEWQPKELFNLLSADKIIFKRNCVWVPTQKYVNNGLFVINVTQKGYHQTRVTSRGILWISKNYL